MLKKLKFCPDLTYRLNVLEIQLTYGYISEETYKELYTLLISKATEEGQDTTA